ncbi:MAG: cobalamin-dependent protein [Myxococcota bacterium]
MDLNIGALSRAAGVPTSTLRTWERRYGFPPATRTPGGQRVYAADVVEHVRLVARAIAAGGRPAQVMAASVEELRSFEPPAPRPDGDDGEAWIHAVEALDGTALRRAFQIATARHGLEGFLVAHVAPFLVAIGDAWAGGRLQVFHEHFASERMREHLAGLWRPMADANAGPVAVLATLPGERHALGLHAAACLVAAAGWRVVMLGADTPPPDVDACARVVGARVVGVSVSSAANAGQVAWDLAGLRARLAADVRLAVGGGGAPPREAFAGPADARFDGVDGFADWLTGGVHVAASPGRPR